MTAIEPVTACRPVGGTKAFQWRLLRLCMQSVGAQSDVNSRSAWRHMASPASMTSDEEQNWVDGTAASYEFVRFTLSDMHGISRYKLIPRRHVDKYLKTGMTLCGGRL